MKLYLIKYINAFHSEDQEFYGWAGDHFICAVVAAETKTKAWNLLKSSCEHANMLGNRDEWSIEELEQPTEPKVHVLAWGSY